MAWCEFWSGFAVGAIAAILFLGLAAFLLDWREEREWQEEEKRWKR